MLRLADLRPVQSLAGDGSPFDRLAAVLRRGDYTAAAIDAPFALPRAAFAGSHGTLLARVAAIPPAADRPFPRGEALLQAFSMTSRKLARATERGWGVNVRSATWNGPRGGAPFAAACLALLARAGRPIWPWAPPQPGLLVEAFPAAQLRAWRLPHQGYGRPDQADTRRRIADGLAEHVALGRWRAEIEASPDALDAVVAAFAGVAVETGLMTVDPGLEDGQIAIMPAGSAGR